MRKIVSFIICVSLFTVLTGCSKKAVSQQGQAGNQNIKANPGINMLYYRGGTLWSGMQNMLGIEANPIKGSSGTLGGILFSTPIGTFQGSETTPSIEGQDYVYLSIDPSGNIEMLPVQSGNIKSYHTYNPFDTAKVLISDSGVTDQYGRKYEFGQIDFFNSPTYYSPYSQFMACTNWDSDINGQVGSLFILVINTNNNKVYKINLNTDYSNEYILGGTCFDSEGRLWLSYRSRASVGGEVTGTVLSVYKYDPVSDMFVQLGTKTTEGQSMDIPIVGVNIFAQYTGLDSGCFAGALIPDNSGNMYFIITYYRQKDPQIQNYDIVYSVYRCSYNE